MAQLNHHGIISVYDFGQTADGMRYIVMEFVDGTDVAHMVHQQRRLPSVQAIAITAHVCDALQYAHERGIIHRDIKPANIMVSYDGSVKVADFGLAKITRSDQTDLTRSGMAMGTLHYISPECLTRGTTVDHRADLYAVGVMLYYMLTGHLPQGLFELPSLQVPGLDPRYDSIITRALRNDRVLRYQSALEMRRDLDAILTRPVEQMKQVNEPAAVPQPVPSRSPASSAQRVVPKKREKTHLFLVAAMIGLVSFAYWLNSSATRIEAPIAEHKPNAPGTTSTPPVDVKLPLLSSGGMGKMGGYRPQLAPTTTTKPAGLLRVPSDITQAEYGTLKLGPAATQRSFAFIIDQPDSLKPRLFVDSNANGDFGDDAPAKWERRIYKHDDGKEEISAHGGFRLELHWDNEKLNVNIEAYRFGTGMPNRPEHVLLYYSDYVRAGSVTLAGKSIPALLCDDDCKGHFSAPTSSLRLDINGDGRFDFKGERFFVKDAFNIGGTNYEIADLSPSGADFRIIPSTRSAPESKPLPILETGKPSLPFDATTLDDIKVAVPTSYKGKVLLLDFWATWCPPCVTEVPHVLAAYQKHHAAGFEILGISLDEDKDKLAAFLKEKNINWQQVCDGLGWKAAIAKLYNVRSIPATFLIDGDTGRILATDARGTGLEPAIAKALADKKS